MDEIYNECSDLVALFYENKQITNNTIDSTIRRTIYENSSDTISYRGKNDIFHKIDSGVWEIRA